MHMADALVSSAVGGAMLAVSSAAVAKTAVKSRKNDLSDEKKIPVMGVMSAFVFAAQMVNFTIPGTGASGHISGGILLAAILGGNAGFLSITAVLLIQALFFADGGLLALGCNIFNMGIVTCLIVYPLIYRPIVKKGLSPKRITVASILAVVVGMQLGAFGVVLEASLSGVTELPFGTFLALMQPIHLVIGLAEGVITAAVLAFVWKTRQELLESSVTGTPVPVGVSVRKVIIVLLVAAVIVGSGLSLLSSSNPDGLEWAILGVTGSDELETSGEANEKAAEIQDSTAVLPDYSIPGYDSAAGTTVSGLVGGGITLAVAGGAAAIITAVKRKKRSS